MYEDTNWLSVRSDPIYISCPTVWWFYLCKYLHLVFTKMIKINSFLFQNLGDTCRASSSIALQIWNSISDSVRSLPSISPFYNSSENFLVFHLHPDSWHSSQIHAVIHSIYTRYKRAHTILYSPHARRSMACKILAQYKFSVVMMTMGVALVVKYGRFEL